MRMVDDFVLDVFVEFSIVLDHFILLEGIDFPEGFYVYAWDFIRLQLLP